jgi:hypothetical protein
VQRVCVQAGPAAAGGPPPPPPPAVGYCGDDELDWAGRSALESRDLWREPFRRAVRIAREPPPGHLISQQHACCRSEALRLGRGRRLDIFEAPSSRAAAAPGCWENLFENRHITNQRQQESAPVTPRRAEFYAFDEVAPTREFGATNTNVRTVESHSVAVSFGNF